MNDRSLPYRSPSKRSPSDEKARAHVADPETGRCVVDGAHLGNTYPGMPRRTGPGGER